MKLYIGKKNKRNSLKDLTDQIDSLNHLEEDQYTNFEIKFFFKENIELTFKISIINEQTFIFMVFQNIKHKIKINENNSKLNYSLLLLSSLGHEMFTPLHHLISLSERIIVKLNDGSQGVGKEDKKLPLKKFSTLKEKASRPLLLADRKTLEDLASIKQISMSLNIFVSNLLDFAAILEDKFELKIQTFKATELIDMVPKHFSKKIAQKGLELKTECSDYLIVNNDFERIKRLIHIFVENAIKFTVQGSILVRISQVPQLNPKVRVEIIDTGTGIEECEMINIREILKKPFSAIQIKNSAGLGIGFRMAQAFLKQLNFGSLNLEITSKKRGGTTVKFEIFQDYDNLQEMSSFDSRSNESKIALKYGLGNEDSSKSLFSLKEKIPYKIQEPNTKDFDLSFTSDEKPLPEVPVSKPSKLISSKKPSTRNMSTKRLPRASLNPSEKSSMFHIDDEKVQNILKRLETASKKSQFQQIKFDTDPLQSPRNLNSRNNNPFLEVEEYSECSPKRTPLKKATNSANPMGKNSLKKSIRTQRLSFGSLLKTSEKGFNSKKSKADSIMDSEYLQMKLSRFSEYEEEILIRQNQKNKGGFEIEVAPVEETDRPIALVVDDEILNCDIAQEILEELGIEAYTAYSGELALNICNRFLTSNTKIDLILMDYSMPEMTGDEVTKILRSSTYKKITEDTKIIGLSAHTDPEIKAKCLLSGMNTFENKPFTSKMLEKLLEKYNLI